MCQDGHLYNLWGRAEGAMVEVIFARPDETGAALAFVVLVVRPPEPRHEYLRRISMPPVAPVSESDGEGTLV